MKRFMWLLTLVSVAFTSMGEGVPFKLAWISIVLIQLGALVYSCLYVLNWKQQLGIGVVDGLVRALSGDHTPIPTIALAMVWNIANTIFTGGLTLWFSFAVLRRLPVSERFLLIAGIVLGILSIYLILRVVGKLE